MDAVETNLDSVTPVTHLLDGLNIDDLTDKGTIFEVHPDDMFDEKLVDDNTFGEELLCHSNFGDCFDSDDNDESESELTMFERLALKMKNVDPNGYVKKRIIQAGNGEKIPENSEVTIHYQGFFEYADEPYDSTFNRSPISVRLGRGELIVGLEIGIASMENREIAEFLIQPIYGYGKLGCLRRIPPDSTLKIRVEIVRVIDSLTADQYEKLKEDDKKLFKNIRRRADNCQDKAKEMFLRKNYKGAIKNYNMAVNYLVSAQLMDMSEQEIQQKQLVKLYSNLSICYNAYDMPRKACTAFNHITQLAANKTITIPAKAYYHHARALMKLSDYFRAKRELEKAKALRPADADILSALCEIQAAIDKDKEEERRRSKMMLSNIIEPSPPQVLDISELAPQFITHSKEFIQAFNDSLDLEQDVPDRLSRKEIQFFQMEAEALNLEFCTTKQADGIYKYCLRKKMKA